MHISMHEQSLAKTRPRVDTHGGIFVDEAADDTLETSGFWSNAEYLRTVRDAK